MLAFPRLSIVITVTRDPHQVAQVISEASTALRHAASLEFVVIDASNGDSSHALARLSDNDPRVNYHYQPGPSDVDSALCWATQLCHSDWIVTLDAEGRDDPYDIPEMLCAARQQGLSLVEGVPARATRLSGIGEYGSRGPRVLQREALLGLPVVDRLNHYLPLLIRRSGGRVQTYRINHRRVQRRGRRPLSSLWRLPLQPFGDLRDWLGMWWLSRRWGPRQSAPGTRRRAAVR